MNRKWITAAVLVGVLGSFGLMAALHRVVVLTARGISFSNAFAVTCDACHRGKYVNFGNTGPN